MRPSGSPAELERRRLRALDLLKEGLLPVEVARRVGVDRRSVRRWRASFDAEGRDGVRALPAPGRPSKMTAAQRARLEKALLRGALAHGYPTDLWTCPRVAELIDRRFGVEYHADHVGRLLHALGWSPQKPERRARERDEEGIRAWVKTVWPRVKKKPAG
jgi:transposase